MIQIPTPSINANKMAPTAADLTAADGPPTDDEKYCQDCNHVCGGMVGYCILFLGKTLDAHSASSTLVYKWGLAILMLGCNHVMD